MPSSAMISRTSVAMNRMKFMQYSGLPVKRRLKLRVLGRDADRAGIQVTLAHHDAAEGDKRG